MRLTPAARLVRFSTVLNPLLGGGPMTSIRFAALLAGMLVCPLAWSWADDKPDVGKTVPASYVGKTVFLKKELTHFGVTKDDQYEDLGVLTAVSYQVVAEAGKEIKVRHSGKEGWLPKAEVVPLSEAVAYFTERLKENPKDSGAYQKRGHAWHLRGEQDKALADLDEAIRLYPKGAALWNSRGIVWIEKKEFDKAIEDFTEAIRLEPQEANAFNSRGAAWTRKKEYDKAIEDFTEAIRLAGFGQDHFLRGLPRRVAQRESAGRRAAHRGASTDLYLPPDV